MRALVRAAVREGAVRAMVGATEVAVRAEVAMAAAMEISCLCQRRVVTITRYSMT